MKRYIVALTAYKIDYGDYIVTAKSKRDARKKAIALWVKEDKFFATRFKMDIGIIKKEKE